MLSRENNIALHCVRADARLSLTVWTRFDRRTGRILCPSAFAQPVVVMLAVSAPSTSWAVDDVILAPFPRIAASIKDIFLAGYSNPDKRDNKLKRMYVRTKKALPQKPPTGYA